MKQLYSTLKPSSAPPSSSTASAGFEFEIDNTDIRPSSEESNKRKVNAQSKDDAKEESAGGIEIKKEPQKIVEPCQQLKALFMLDGEHAQLVHFLKNFHEYKMDSFDIAILKLAAACSATQQPCDILRAFHILHQFYASKAYIHTNFDNVSIPSYMANVMYAIRDIPAASRKVYENFFMPLEGIVSKAYTGFLTRKGFITMGIPGPTRASAEMYDFRQTLSQWTGWDSLSTNQQDELIKRVIAFAEKLIKSRSASPSLNGEQTDEFKGTALDIEMEAAFGDIVGQLDYDCQGKNLALNRWRATLINDPAVYKVYLEKELAKEVSAQKKRAKKSAGDDGVLGASADATVTPTPTTDTVVLDADAAEVKQTKVLCMLCKAHFLRKSGSRGLLGLPACWRGCEGCKAFMCCDQVKCRSFFEMHTESCAAK